MNDATLNIIVRVHAKQAQAALAGVTAATRGMASGSQAGTAAASKGFTTLTQRVEAYRRATLAAAKANMNFAVGITNSNLIKHGKNLNWVGRQLTYNFTLPIALAGAAIFKFQKDVEAAMVQVRKVYGDASFGPTRVKEETDALAKSFELLSTRYGVHQKEVIDIAAAWASAGSAGRGLAENTRLTMETMILGEMDAAEATEALIAIQATWKLSTKENADGISEMSDMLAILNVVENETGIRMSGLVEVFERAGGTARSAGVSIEELAAMAAALVPATGGAEQAGNALKTIFSRLQAPTRATIELLEKIGFTVGSEEWLGKSVTKKLEALADQWGDLSEAQKTYAASVLGSRWQVNRLNVLMEDMSGEIGYYEKALAAASDEEERNKILKRELNTVLNSEPRKWDILTNSIRNSLAKAFIPLMPAIIGVVGIFADLALKFSELDVNTQKLIILGLTAVAVAGPLLMIAGNLMQLVGAAFTATKVILGFGQVFGWVMLMAVTKSMKFAKSIVPFFRAIRTKAFAPVWKAAKTLDRVLGRVFVNILGMIPRIVAAFWAFGGKVVSAIGFVIRSVFGAVRAIGGFVLTAGRAIAGIFRAVRTFISTFQILAFGVRGGLAYLVTSFGGAVTAIAVPLWAIVAVILAVAAAITAILKTDIEDPFVRTFKRIVGMMAQLPGAIAQIFRDVVQVLGRAMAVVLDFLSYLNPFQRHSPSLVDNVRAGVAVILSEYSKLQTIPGMIASALSSLDAFNSAASGDRMGFRQAELADKVDSISSVSPAGGQAASVMAQEILQLERVLPRVAAEIAAQSSLVAKLSESYDRAAQKVERADNALGLIRQEMDETSVKIAEAEQIISDLSNAPLTGMIAMEDQIFANKMAQDELNLRLLEMGRAAGGIDGVKDRMAALNGEMEMMRGERNGLRLAGAGSDILGVYDAQIAALDEERDAMKGVAGEINEIEKALDDLDMEGRFLELTRSITFDPLLRQIDKVASGVEEMTFDEILAGVTAQKQTIDNLSAAYAEMEAAEKRAQEVLDTTTIARDRIGDQLDAEVERLDQLKDAYSDIEGLIRDMESAMDDYLSLASSSGALDDAANKAKDAKGSLDLFDAGAGVDFPVEGGDNLLSPEGGLLDIEEFNKEMQDEIDALFDELSGDGLGELFSGITEKIDEWKEKIGNKINEWKEKIEGWWDKVWGWFEDGIDGITGVKDWFEDLGSEVWESIKSGTGDLADLVGGWIDDNIVSPISTAIGGVASAFTTLGTTIWGVIYTWIVAPILFLVDTVVSAFNDWIIPAVVAVGGFFADVFNNVIAPVFRTVAAVVMWFVDLVVEYWNAYLFPIFDLFSTIVQIIATVVAIKFMAIWEIVSAVIGWVVDKIGWLIENLGELWTWVDDVWGWISGAFQWGWEQVEKFMGWIGDKLAWLEGPLEDLEGFATSAWNLVETGLQGLWDFFSDAWDGMTQIASSAFSELGDLFSTIWDEIRPVGTALKWLYNSVVKPIMNAIGLVFKGAWNGVIDVIEGGINAFIGAFNLIAGAVSKVAGLLGIDGVATMERVNLDNLQFSFSTAQADKLVNGGGGKIPLMESGGTIGRSGGIANRARAIVGEGSNVHPEYVIPTDPKWRQRAMGLYSELGNTFGMTDDGYSSMDLWGSIGGFVSAGKNAAVGGLKAIGGMIKEGAIKALWNPAKWLAQQAISAIPQGMFRNAGQGILDGVDGWITGADSAWSAESKNRMPPAAIDGTGSWKVIPQLLNRLGIPYKVLSTYRPGARTRNSGNLSWHARNRAIDLSGPSGMINYNHNDMLAINHAIYDAYKPQLKELIYGGPGAKNVFRGRDYSYKAPFMREHINHVHAALARGGFVVPKTQGGSLFRIGEGLHDEAVQVVPLNGQRGTQDGISAGGGREINFYGDLSFPNITDPNDAEKFIANLEVLAGGN